MANADHRDLLREGTEAWNAWRVENPQIVPDLCEIELPNADLAGANLSRALLIDSNLSGAGLQRAKLERAILGAADLSRANLSGAGLTGAELNGALLEDADLTGAMLDHATLAGAVLHRARLVSTSMLRASFKQAHLRNADLRGTSHNKTDFTGADLTEADLSDTFAGGGAFARAKLSGAILTSTVLSQSDLTGADLSNANLKRADLTGAKLEGANLSCSDLSGADLSKTQLSGADLSGARIVNCAVFGVSAWGAELEGAEQKNLRITDMGEAVVSVDGIELAQFTHLLLQSGTLRATITDIASKVVLILGHFREHREPILEAMRNSLRESGYSPILFDSEPRRGREIIETMGTLARMARFVIADFTEATSVAHELRSIVPDLPHIPVQPLLIANVVEEKTIDQLRHHGSVLAIYRYENAETLIDVLHDRVIVPSEALARQLTSL
jgi:uncharacterized protein YjbI with pentapeptide repeats